MKTIEKEVWTAVLLFLGVIAFSLYRASFDPGTPHATMLLFNALDLALAATCAVLIYVCWRTK